MAISSETPPADQVNSAHADGAQPPRSTEQVSALVQQIVVSRAAELAQHGHYDDAESLLESLQSLGLSPLALDLLARIRAQQGRLEEAKALWLMVLQVRPGDGDAKAGLDRILRLEARRSPRRNRDGSPAGRLPQRDGSTAAGPRPPELRIDVPGVSLQPDGDEMVATFDFPLFARADAELSSQAKRVLAALGWQLEPCVGSIAILIVGQPDALPDDAAPVPRDVAALGMARAVAVFNYLTETTKLQARMFSLCTGEDFLLGGDGRDKDGKARTDMPLVLRISARR